MHTLNRLMISILFFCLSFGLAGCNKTENYIDFSKAQPVPAKDYSGEKEQRPLIIALASVISPEETIKFYRIIAQQTAVLTGHPTVLVQRKTYAEINMLLSNGEADIAFLSTGAYAAYHGMNEIELLAMAERDGDSLYNTDVIVHRDSTIYSLADLKGKTFAFTDPLSLSGHLVIENSLLDQNTMPEKYFKRYFYTYNHDKSLWAVANHIADAASIDSQIYEYAKLKTPELTERVRIIASLNPAPTGPLVIRKNLPTAQKEQLRQIFLEMNQDPDTAQAMQKLMIDRFVPPQPKLYEPLKKIYDRISAYYANSL